MLKKLYVMGYVCIAALLCQGMVAAAEEIVMVFGAGWPPFYSKDLKEGMFIEFLDAFEKEYPDFTITREVLPRKRMDMWMEEGKAQAFSLNSPLFVDKDKIDQFLFTNPLWTTSDHVIMHKDNIFEYKQPEDLFGKRVGIIHGNSYGALDPFIESRQIRAEPVQGKRQLFQMLEKGRVDAIFGNKHVDPYQMKQYKIDQSQFVFSETPLFQFDLVIQVQKTHPHFVETLNEFIEKSKENGFLQQLEDKYVK